MRSSTVRGADRDSLFAYHVELLYLPLSVLYIIRIHDDGNPTQLWRPGPTWRGGEALELTYPPITALAGERLGIGAQIGNAEGVPRRDERDPSGG